MLCEPGFTGGVVGDGAFEASPEMLVVMWLAPVDEFVGDDDFGDAGGSRTARRGRLSVWAMGFVTDDPAAVDDTERRGAASASDIDMVLAVSS